MTNHTRPPTPEDPCCCQWFCRCRIDPCDPRDTCYVCETKVREREAQEFQKIRAEWVEAAADVDKIRAIMAQGLPLKDITKV